MAAQMTCQPLNENTTFDEDYQEFVQELRDEIIMQYSTILISIAESKDINVRKTYEQHLG